MKDNLRPFINDNFIKISLFSSIVLIIVQVVFIVIFSPSLPPIIPLLNSQPWGVARLYPSSYILFLVPISLIIFAANNFLSSYFYKKNTLIARILCFNASLFIFLGLLAYIQIILLVF